MRSPFQIASEADVGAGLQAQADQMRARRRGIEQEAPAATVEDRLKQIAAETRIPRNVLLAVVEASGATEPKEVISAAANAGIRLSRAVRGGQSLREALSSITGDEGIADAITRRAEQWANEIDPDGDPENRARPQDYNALRDAPAQILGDFGNFIGRGAARVGEAFDRAVVRPAADVLINRPARALGAPEDFDVMPAVSVGSAAGQAVDKTVGALGRAIDRHVVSRAAKETRSIDPDADLFRPSTWKLDSEASVAGFIQAGASVLGSMLPVIAAGIFTGGTGAAAMGGMIGFGGAADEASAVLDQMAAEVTQGGQSTRLYDESAVYRDLVDSGVPHAQALAQTKAQAADIAGTLASVPAAIGGALTQRIMRMPATMAGKVPTRLGRAAVTGAVSALEEGAQEVTEGVVGRLGANTGAGIDQSLTAGTGMEFALGALAGGVPGAISGAMSRNRAREIEIDQSQPAPPPIAGLLPPGQINQGGRGPLDGVPAGDPGPFGPGAAQPAPFRPMDGAPRQPMAADPAAAPVPPAGPLSSAAAKAPDPLLADGIAGGSQVYHIEIEGAKTPIEARILRETPFGVEMHDQITGDTFTVPREEIEAGKVRITQIPDAVPQQEITSDAPRPPSPPEQGPAPATAPDPQISPAPAVRQPAAPAVDAPPAPPAPLDPAPDAGPAGGLTPGGVQISGVDAAIANGTGRIEVSENGQAVPFKNFALSVDGDTAEVGFVERDKSARAGIGFDAYVALGRDLAGRGITLQSTQTLQADGRKLWEKLVRNGLATYDAQAKRFRFGPAQNSVPGTAGNAGNISPDGTSIPGAETGAQGNRPKKVEKQPGHDAIMQRDYPPPNAFGRFERLTTGSGRLTAPFPEIRADTPAKATNSVKRINKWWLTEAIAEMDAKGLGADTARRMLQSALDTENITPSDLSIAEMVLGELARGEAKLSPEQIKANRERAEKEEIAAAVKARAEAKAEAEAQQAAIAEMEGREPTPEDQAAIDASMADLDAEIRDMMAGGEVEVETDAAPEPEPKPMRPAADQDFARRMVHRARARARLRKELDIADGFDPNQTEISDEVMRRAVTYLNETQGEADDRAIREGLSTERTPPIKMPPELDAEAEAPASNDDQKGQEPVAEGEIPIPPGALSEADQETAPSAEPAFMGVIRDRLRAGISVTLPRAGRIDRLVDLDSRVRWESGLGLLYIPPRGRSEVFTPAEMAKMEADFPVVAAQSEAMAEVDAASDQAETGKREVFKDGETVMVSFTAPDREQRMTIIGSGFNSTTQGWSYQVKGDGPGSVIVPASRIRELTEAEAAAGVADQAAEDPGVALGKRWNKLKGPGKALILQAAGLPAEVREKSWHELTPAEQRAIGATLAANDQAAGQKIEDFGRGKITGSRKDLRAQMMEELARDVGTQELRDQPLSKVWPESDWAGMIEGGMDPRTVHALAVLRNSAGRKPTSYFEGGAWADRVKISRDLSKQIMEGEIPAAAAFKVKDDPYERKYSREAQMGALWELMEGIDPSEVSDFSKVRLGLAASVRAGRDENGKDIWHDGISIEMPWQQRTRGGFMRGATFDKEVEGFEDALREHIRRANAARREYLASARGENDGKKVTLSVGARMAEGPDGKSVRVFVINADYGSGEVEIYGEFESREKADAYLAENEADLIEQAREDRAMPGAEWKSFEDMVPRANGPAWRDGDVTPKMFMDSFGLTESAGFAAQFGKSTPQKERQKRLNDTYDALMDLAAIIGLPPKALFLNDRLKLAFGARGKGGKGAGAAHFEPDQKVINLTRINGAGTLSHEWFHALDNFIATLVNEHRATLPNSEQPYRLDYTGKGQTKSERRRPFSDVRKEYATATDALLRDADEKVDPKLRRALKAAEALRNVLRTHDAPWFKRLREMDKTRGSNEYWTTTIEMAARAFERMVHDRLAERGIQNDFLVGIAPYGGAYPDQREAHRQGVDKAILEFMDAVRDLLTAEGDTTFTADLPPIDITYAYVGPKLGQSWPGPNGVTRRIINVIQKPDRPARFEVDMGDGKDSDIMSEDDVERLIDADAKLTDPKVLEQMGVRKAAQDAIAAAEKLRRDNARERFTEILGEGDALNEILRQIETKRLYTGISFDGDVDHAVFDAITLFDKGYRLIPAERGYRILNRETRWGWKTTQGSENLRAALRILQDGEERKSQEADQTPETANDEELSHLFGGKPNADGADNDGMAGGKGPAQDGDDQQGGTPGVQEVAESEGAEPGQPGPDAGTDGGAKLGVPDAVQPGEPTANLSSADMILQAFDEIASETETDAEPAGDVESAWALFDDADRKEAMRAAGIKDGVATRNAGKEWGELPQAIRDALSAEWAKTPPDVQSALSGQNPQGNQGGGATPVQRPSNTGGSSRQPPRTAGQAASSAASNAAAGAKAAFDGLNALFDLGNKGRLGSGPNFDEETYARAKPFFAQAIRSFGQAGQDIMDIVRAMVRGFVTQFGMTQEGRERMMPYMVRYVDDIRAGLEDPFADQLEQENDGEPDQGSDPGRPAPRDEVESDEDRGGRDGEDSDGNEGNRDDAGDGNDPGTGVDGGGRDLPQALSGENPGNYVLTDADAIGTGTPGQRIRANIEAIRIVKALEAEHRYATREEQAKLAKFVGWGGLRPVLDPVNAGKSDQNGRAQAELREILTPAEYNAAFDSATAAHYTAPGVVRAMWDAMAHFGFKGGRALEPTMGVGNFLGFQPEAMASDTEWHGAELDPMTGKIAAALYPDANVMHSKGFEDAAFGKGAFDIAIGNPPFGDLPITRGTDKSLSGMKIHNYIIAKTGTHLRPGGIMAMVVTHRFLDTPNPEARDRLAKDFRFMGAIRLPNDAFKANAGTEVTTDIVFLQKLRPGEDPGSNSWLDTKGKLADGIRVSRYFAENPQNILGRSAMDGVMYGGRGNEYTVHSDGRDLGAAIKAVFETGTMAQFKDALGERTEQLEDAVMQDMAASVADGGFYLDEKGDLFIREGENMVPVTAETTWGNKAVAMVPVQRAIEALRDTVNDASASTMERLNAYERAKAEIQSVFFTQKGDVRSGLTEDEGKIVALAKYGAPPSVWNKMAKEALAAAKSTVDRGKMGAEGVARLKGLINLRKNAMALMAAERSPHSKSADLEAMRAKLNTQYDAFVAKFGLVNDPANVSILRGDEGIEFSLEFGYRKPEGAKRTGGTAEKADLLVKRVFTPFKRAEKADSVEDGLLISMMERGGVDIPLIASLTGKDGKEVIEELTAGEDPRIFFNPETGAYEDAESYLSGNVKEKLAIARAESMSQNVRALEKNQPKPMVKDQITPNVRAMWIPTEISEGFLAHMGVKNPKVTIYADAGRIAISGDMGTATEFGAQFRHDAKDPLNIFRSIVTGKPIKVEHRDPMTGRKEVDDAASKEVNALGERMAAEFEKWAYQSSERADIIVSAYNQKMNTHVERQFDGVKYLRPVGLSPLMSPGGKEAMRNSQLNGAWRMITSASALMHHVVGAGKTRTAIVAIMERRRMGLSKKPLVVVPNHLVGQWKSDFLLAYPGARVLAVGADDFSGANRRRVFGRIATGDWDAIIIGHSQITRIENDPADAEKIIQEQLDLLRETLNEARANRESGRTLTQISNMIKNYEDRLNNLRDKAAERADDIGLNFRQLGIDYLVVDESQEFKNLEYQTGGERLVGMNSPTGSQRAFDLYIKTRRLLDGNESGKEANGVAFLTGTPVSNSLVEIYSLMKYLAPKQLKARGVMHFDAWSGAYVQAETRFEYNATNKIVARRVMARLINLRTLSQLYREFADVILGDRLREIYAEQIREENKRTENERGAKGIPPKSERFPTPKVKGGGRQIDIAPATPAQILYTDFLASRMQGMRKQNPKEYQAIDNALWVLGDARKAAIDIRNVDPDETERHPNSKSARAANRIHEIWARTGNNLGTQLVFSDLSTPKKQARNAAVRLLAEAYVRADSAKPAAQRIKAKDAKAKAEAIADAKGGMANAWAKALEAIEAVVTDPATKEDVVERLNDWVEANMTEAAAAMATFDSGFSVYDDLKAALIEKGIPAEQIAFIHDYEGDAAKPKLFRAVKDGEIRVLIGSSQKMGAGTNVQDRVVALHHMDAPWRPSDVEQREGRIIRSGNTLYEADPEGFEVEIWAYSTEGTSDTVMWQVLERKARSIEGFMSGALDTMEEDNDDSDKYADFMAASTGNPVFKWKLEAERDLLNAEAEVSGLLSTREDAKSFLRTKDERIAHQRSIERLDGQVKLEKATVKISGRTIEANPQDLAPALSAYRDKYNAAVEAYEKARAEWEKADAERKAKIAAGEKVEAREKAPQFDMPTPSIYAPEVQEASSYARLIKEVLSAVRAGRPEQEIRIQFDDAHNLMVAVSRSPTKLDPNKSDYSVVSDIKSDRDIENGRLTGTRIHHEGARVTDPLSSTVLERTLMPGTFRGTIAWMSQSAGERAKAMEERVPVAEKQAEIEIDQGKVATERAKVAYYTGAVAIAEAERELSQRDQPVNPFIIKDQVKHPERVYSVASGGLVEANLSFTIASGNPENDGTYQGSGIGSAPEVAPGIFSNLIYFDGTRIGDGKKAIFRATKAENMDNARPGSPKADGDITVSGLIEGKSAVATEVAFEPERPVTAAERRSAERRGTGDIMRDPMVRGAWEARIAAEMARIGIPSGKVSAHLVEFVRGFGADRGTLGLFVTYKRTGKGRIQVSGRWGEAETMLTLRHEIIHAMKAPDIWGNEFGLFTRGEWEALVRAARSDIKIRKWVSDHYGDQPPDIQTEEMVAEYFARWAADQDTKRDGSFLARALAKMRDMFRAISRLIAYGPFEGSMTGEKVMQDILSGSIGPRGNPKPPGPRRVKPDARTKAAAEARAQSAVDAGILTAYEARAGIEALPFGEDFDDGAGNAFEARARAGIRATSGSLMDAFKARVRSAVTKAMSGDYNAMALVPGRALFDELGGHLMAAKSYMRSKNAMEVDRNNWITRTQEMADKWRAEAVKDPESNKTMMEIMHESTIHEVDPTAPFKSHLSKGAAKLITEHGTNPDMAASKEHRAAIKEWEHEQERRAAYARIKAKFDALPARFQERYAKVRDEYRAMQKEYDDALSANIDKVAEISIRRSARRLEKRIREIEEDGSLTRDEKDEAIQKAEETHEKATKTAKDGASGRAAGMRKLFESNRIKGPYFPLSRFGDFFVTERDGDGHVVRFSRFESEKEQMAAVKDAKAQGYDVEHGVLSERNSVRGMVDPTFVTEVESLLAGADVSKEIMDAVWQKWLETLPDVSVRKSRIHRKGRAGYVDDAFRAFTNQQFHASYQLARLKHGLDMQDALDEAELEAARSSDPNRNGLIVREMVKRHQTTMNPMGKPWTSYVTSGAFVWYLGLTPAAAVINVTQTTVMGVPILSAISKSGHLKAMGEAAAEIGRASQDFLTSKNMKIENNERLTDDERRAIHAGYEMGVLDKTQAHDLAGMAEEGLRYNPTVAKAMKIVSWGFHHAERFNREVTFTAAYRMARKAGQDHEAATQTAMEATYKAHFSYQASDRPRFMQGDAARALFVFRQHQTNMIWRLFRDVHQATKGETEQVRREARRQLLGITAMMMVHAGVSGTWLFGITMMIAGLFFGGGADEAEAEFKSAIVDLFGTTVGGAIWYGSLNQMTGLDLSGRIGMPDLWFRSEGRDMEGEDAYNAMIQQMIGAAPGIIEGFYRGAEMIGDGHWYRGVEAMLPKAMRDVMRANRFLTEGAQTLNGNSLMDEVGALDAARQILGFTPAKISERYEVNNYLKNKEGRIIDRRQRIQGDMARAIIAGERIPEDVIEKMNAFNKDFPEYPITAKTLKQSVRSRIRAAEANEFGITLNAKLNSRLRAEAPPIVN